MPLNDDMKHQGEDLIKDHASGDASVASVLPDDHAAVAEEINANEAIADPLSPDCGMPQEFTFFQKKKRLDQAGLAPTLAYVSTAQLTAFAARVDRAVAVNGKTQLHIDELMRLMSDVSRTLTTDVSKPTRKRLRRSKWLFYGCLMGFGVGWFLLFPSGHNLLSKLVAFLTN